MDYTYSRYRLGEREGKIERFWEIVPAALSWGILIGMAGLSFFRPFAAATLIIAFLIYWLMRLIYMNIFLVLSYLRLAIEKELDWMERISGIDNLGAYPGKLCAIRQKRGLKHKIAAFLHCRQLEDLTKTNRPPPPSADIYHLVIIPVIKERREVIQPGIRGIQEGDYPAKRILVVIALEERAPDDVKEDVSLLAKEYQGGFLDLLVIVHPDNLPGEARVKGANVTYAAKQAAEYFDKINLPYENILVSCFDADSVPTRNYFSCLAYHFMITADRLRASYQPVPVYYNNFWEVPGFARVMDIGTSFFQLIETTNPQKLVTFSSHSMSFKALVEVGYWPVDMISDDSAIFWKAFIHYDGNYQVVPMYTTVSMDIVVGHNLRETFMNIYRQKRRWAWGVENLPIVIRAFFKPSKTSLYKKLSYGYKLFDVFISWATWSFFLVFIIWLPTLFAAREFVSSTAYYTVPRIRVTIFGLASVGMLICMILSFLLLPKTKKKRSLFELITHGLEWLSIPAAVLVLSALPAIDAQTRLMLGKYMDFWVTEKYRGENK